MVMAREFPAVLSLQIRASLVRTGMQSIGSDNLAKRTSVRVRYQICKVRRIAAFANAGNARRFAAPRFLRLQVSANQVPAATTSGSFRKRSYRGKAARIPRKVAHN